MPKHVCPRKMLRAANESGAKREERFIEWLLLYVVAAASVMALVGVSPIVLGAFVLGVAKIITAAASYRWGPGPL